MGLTFSPVITKSLAKQISETIHQAILHGELKVDERLPTEPELAQRFGVSRPTIREALKRLAAQNLIRSRRGPSGGTFVNCPDTTEAQTILTNMTSLLTSMGEFNLSDIAEARRELETTCIQFAALRRTETHLQAMAAEISLQKDPTLKDEDFCASDVRFHRAIVDAAQNSMLKFMMSSVIESMQPIVNLIVFPFWDKQKTIRQHEDILTALTKKNASDAVRVFQAQMDDLDLRYSKAQSEKDHQDRDKP